jgi:hypothetical protein
MRFDITPRLRHLAGWVVTLSLAVTTAQAIPSFTRQTGVACEQCHTVAYGPALTPYGRQFKLNGYTWGTQALPISFMVQGGYTHTAQDQPDPPAEHTAVNNNLSVDQVSLFYGGKITDHLGAFAQFTYSGPDRAFSWDNLDIRYARTVSFGNHSAVLGVSLNNNPTVQDLWNSTPAWGFPYISSALAPSPAAGTLVTGLGGTVLGTSAYAMVDDHWYLEVGGYRGLSDRWLGNVGAGADASPHLDGVAPYVRAAYQWDGEVHHGSIGVLSLAGNLHPDPAQPATDRYVDTGVDATYQWSPGTGHAIAANAAYIHETRSLQASYAQEAVSYADQHVDSLLLDVTYVYQATWSAGLGYFDIKGSSDPLVYTPDPFSGSATGSPDSRGTTWKLEYIPWGKASTAKPSWQNLRVGVEYTAYDTFNGASSNYDGAGRNAHDNNTLFVYFWIIH